MTEDQGSCKLEVKHGENAVVWGRSLIMLMRTFLSLLFALRVSAPAFAAKRNVLLIVADDLGFQGSKAGKPAAKKKKVK